MVNGSTPTQIPPLLSINKKLPIVPGFSPAYRAAAPTYSITVPPPFTPTTSVSQPISPSPGNGLPLVPSFATAYRAPPIDGNLVASTLRTALESLKKVFQPVSFLETERGEMTAKSDEKGKKTTHSHLGLFQAHRNNLAEENKGTQRTSTLHIGLGGHRKHRQSPLLRRRRREA
jgi:hypothetical protein